MPRTKKKRSIYLDRAQSRLTALRTINPDLDFGHGLTAAAFDELILQTRQALIDYNTILSNLDRAYNTYKTLERSMNDMTTRMLTGVATQYGKESTEYEMAGGTRPSERRKPQPKPPSPPTEG